MPTTSDPQQIRAALQTAFPDAEVSDELVDAYKRAIEGGHAQNPDKALETSGPVLSFGDEQDEAIRYYTARAVHARSGGTTSIFEGILPQVRVRLPDRGGMQPIETSMGLVLPTDRKILSASQVKLLVGREAGRVELITAPRSPDAKGGRFGAIALYLCYANACDNAPSFYLLEAGTATGQPKVLFYGETMTGWIKNQHTAYQPTPFSGPKNYYNGLLTMSAEDPNEPSMLVVQGRAGLDERPYIQVTVQYSSSREAPTYEPLDLILDAAARVGMVGEALGASVDTSIKLATFLRSESLEWIAKPGE